MLQINTVLDNTNNSSLEMSTGFMLAHNKRGQNASWAGSNAIKQTINVNDLYSKGFEMQYTRCWETEGSHDVTSSRTAFIIPEA
jgi:hypothetical protein